MQSWRRNRRPSTALLAELHMEVSLFANRAVQNRPETNVLPSAPQLTPSDCLAMSDFVGGDQCSYWV
jgi:hypothetical protein